MDTLFCITIDNGELERIKKLAQEVHIPVNKLLTEKMINMTRILKSIKSKNPYPDDIFLPMMPDDWKKVIQVLQNAQITPDKVFANWGRRVWDDCINSILKEFQEE